MLSELLIAQLKKIFERKKNYHLAWLIQGEFGVDFDDFLQNLCEKLFDLNDFKNSANVFYIYEENEIKIEEIRKINLFLHNKSEKWRIIIIQNLDKMNQNAANALLKILEEPPARTIFICTAIVELPMTIFSRMNVFLLSIEKNQDCDDEIMQIANGSNVIAEQISEFGGLESIELVRKIVCYNDNHDALVRLLEMNDLSKHFSIIFYLILYFFKEKLLLSDNFISKKKIFYQYEKIVELMSNIEKFHCNKKAFLFSFLR